MAGVGRAGRHRRKRVALPRTPGPDEPPGAELRAWHRVGPAPAIGSSSDAAPAFGPAGPPVVQEWRGRLRTPLRPLSPWRLPPTAPVVAARFRTHGPAPPADRVPDTGTP